MDARRARVMFSPALAKKLSWMRIAAPRATERVARSRPAHTGGFATLHTEHRLWVPPQRIEGVLPGGLTGTLYRNGPGRNELGGSPFGHWFDGDGMVHAFTLRDGRVHYQNRYVRTPKYLEETRAGRVTRRSYGQNRPGGVLRNVGRFPAHTANTGVVYHGGQLLALWEGGRPYALDPTTLDTIGIHDYGGRLGRGDTFSAHGRIDPRTGRYHSFGVRVTPRGPELHLYDVSPRGHLVRRGAVPVGNHPFVHDFALTSRHMVFFLSPLRMRALVPFLLGATTFDRALAYEPGSAMRVLVVRRSDFQVVRTLDVDPFLVMHYANAWEDGDDIVLDLVRFEDFAVNDAMRNVFQGIRADGGRLVRHRIDVVTGRVDAQPLCDVPCEFPTFDSRHATAPTRVLFACALLDNATPGFFNGILRLDTSTGETRVLDLGPGRFTSEVLFVPRAPDAPEGDGHLLSVVFDAARQASSLVILSAEDPREVVAQVHLDHHVPFGFHGFFTRSTFV
jgi:all-trans-8'-apo-beta-carotenal 15,15'-oxygenase